MARQCVFCGGAKLTREHVFPQWLTAVLPEQERWRGHDQLTVIPGNDVEEGEPLHREMIERFNGATVKVVCAPCNNGFMQAIEEAARPALSAMIRGELAITLDAAKLTKIATWAVKTSLMSQLTSREPASLDPIYKALYRDHVPPPHCRVWIGQVDDEEWGLRAESVAVLVHREGEETSVEDPPNVVCTTIGLGSLLLHTFIPLRPDQQYFPELEGIFKGLIPIWPNPTHASWPPARITSTYEAWGIVQGLAILYGE